MTLFSHPISSLLLYQFTATTLVIVLALVLNWVLKTAMAKLGEFKNVPPRRHRQVYKYFRFILIILTGVVLLMVWGVDYRGLVVVASSILAMLAVALVAQWSILSNITSGVLIFFSFPAKIGDRIEIIDGNTSICGEIIEINLFQLILEDENKQRISYPNNLLLQKAVRKLNKSASKTKRPSSLRQRQQNR